MKPKYRRNKIALQKKEEKEKKKETQISELAVYVAMMMGCN